MLPEGVFDKIVTQAKDLPAMSVIASKAVKLVSSSTSSAKDMGELISRDQAIAAKVLKLSNSALYSFSREITSIREAVVILGFQTLKSLLLTVSYHQIHGDKKAFGLEENLMWKHSIAVAVAAREIAKEIHMGDQDEVFTVGLIHDIGKVILSKYLGSIFSKIFQKVYNENLSFREVEKSITGFTHNELGAAVLRKWQFPELLIKVVELHNEPEKANLPDSKLPLIVYCADQIALSAGYGIGKSNENEIFPSELTSVFKMGMSNLEAVKRRLDDIMKQEDSFMKI